MIEEDYSSVKRFIEYYLPRVSEIQDFIELEWVKSQAEALLRKLASKCFDASLDELEDFIIELTFRINELRGLRLCKQLKGKS